ncbi:hypothetical protein QLQ12_25965 [Actinoplanes sp. NEAU-A12]|uniref:Uncharacterized protein n=1 Tax=Actinoplanes sandaracinus TaxID=3045177 RepID=A0ABT6WQR0_9ACTN|nr:hypothetical protein [Actinoplanes sandaracinus]MDI6102070.1 hypothetical protein [Actinoplanes sandaracinus]
MAETGADTPPPRHRQVGLQFHACGPEAINMVASWAKEHDLAAALGRLFPDEQVAVRDGDFTAALAIIPLPDFVMLSRRPLHLGNDLRFRELAEANTGALILNLGRHTAEGIRESALGAITYDSADLELWRRLIARARRSMRSGAIITNQVTGASAETRSHRYTDEALQLQSTGVTMLATAGWNTYQLSPDLNPA